MRQENEPILVVVLGNEVAGDDALGPRVARELEHRRLPHVDVVDLGLDPSRLIDLLPGREMLLVIDAVEAEGAAGRVIDCPWDEAVAAVAHDVRLSTHGLSVADQLRLAGAVGALPPVVWFVGVTVSDFEAGRACSVHMPQFVRAAADRAVLAIRTRGQRRETLPV
jgi:hydrogenase maturation protease